MAAKPIYERLEGEPARAFHAFTVYRDMGPKRTIDKVCEALKENDTGEATNPQQRRSKKRADGQYTEWSTRWHWVDRALAWDDYLDQQQQKELLRENNATVRRQVKGSQKLQEIAAKRLQAVQPDELSPMQAMAFLLSGQREERHLRGIDPSDRGEVFTKDQVVELCSQLLVALRPVVGQEKMPAAVEAVQAMVDKPPEIPAKGKRRKK